MGNHLNPGNMAFEEILNGYYIDKSGLINMLNPVINTPNKLVCISRPRRFGKSFAAKMLTAYYDCSCDSHRLFDPLEVSSSMDYEKHINAYNVITFDVTGYISEVKQSDGKLRMSGIPGMIVESIRSDLVEICPQLSKITELGKCLRKFVDMTGRKIVFIIDEWDALIREGNNDTETQSAYLNLLRGLFKNNDITPYVVAAAYMTGILPIKKDGYQSAISDFNEYSIIDPGGYAKYSGFTEEEVIGICEDKNIDFTQVKYWYDGYNVGSCSDIYNPYAVMKVAESREFISYWKKTSAVNSLLTYIEINEEGLLDDILSLANGGAVSVDVSNFANDIETFNSKDDVLTLLVHLGYLTYERVNNNSGIVNVPNEEVYSEFRNTFLRSKHPQLIKLINTSKQLIKDTLAGNESAVASIIEQFHDMNYAPTFYNNEQALRSIIRLAYVACVDQYIKTEELPSGKGVADVVYIPQIMSREPAIIIELKWDKSTDSAIEQIINNNYPAIMNGYEGDIILAGINYDSKTKKHTCRIERVRKAAL